MNTYVNSQNGPPGPRNIDTEPMFTDASRNEYKALCGYTAISLADNPLVHAELNIYRNSGFINSTVGIGAFEFNCEFPYILHSYLNVDDNPIYRGVYKETGQVRVSGIAESVSDRKVIFKSEFNIVLNLNFRAKAAEQFETLIEEPSGLQILAYI